MTKKRIGILGATGLVGQRLALMLENHPWFEVSAVAASDRSIGKRYGDAAPWRLAAPMPAAVSDLTVGPCEPPLDCDLVISSLPSGIASIAEPAFAAAGYPVISNSSALRMHPDVPLVIPEVNWRHVDLIDAQRRLRGWDRGFVLTNPNCSAIALVLALAPLAERFGLETVAVTTMQAISGAGYPGVASIDITDNVVPFIDGEEEKLEEEPGKLLGVLAGDHIEPASFRMSAQCNRVNVQDGHLESVRLSLQRKASREDLLDALASWSSLPQELGLPSAPASPVLLRTERDRPQPRLDRDASAGMSTVVGRVAPDTIFDWKMTLLGNNVVRGAAGAAILNAELLVALERV